MKVVRLRSEHDFEAWRETARGLLIGGTAPAEVRWEVARDDLFAAPSDVAPVTGRAVGVVPERFIELAKVALFHQDPLRFGLLYRVLFRLQKDKSLLSLRSDPDVARLYKLVSDLREQTQQRAEARNHPAPPMISPPEEEVEAPMQDERDEAARITSLAAARAAVQGCTRCALYKYATQAVFGEGPKTAEVMFVGEQPGDQEDLAGQPFVGPAGGVFDRAMEKVGIDRRRVYVTNAVKHFKFVERGKRRIHAKPNGIEISACRPWLEAELTAIEPELVVCLGATAAQSLMGRDFRITSERGKFFPHQWAKEVVATVHPSAVLRMPDRFAGAAPFSEFTKSFHEPLGRPKCPSCTPSRPRPCFWH